MRGAWVLLLLGGQACAAERVCFHTPAEAALQAGATDVDGFRLETTRRDALAGTTWAMVRSCARPEAPARWVFAGGLTPRAGSAWAGAPRRTSIAEAVMRAGTRVTLLVHSTNVQVETSAVALENGVVGDRVRVRIVGASAEAGERIAEGVVRDAKVVEVNGEAGVQR